MPLQCRFFHIHAIDNRNAEEELNRFLKTVRIVNIHREFVNQGENSFWSVVVEYLTDEPGKTADTKGKGRPRIDYREVLSSDDFAIYAKLREWRKEVAGKDAVPVYTVFTNEQLAKIAEKRITTEAGFQEIGGIGEARIRKYGEAVIRIVTQASEDKGQETQENETDRKTLFPDSDV